MFLTELCKGLNDEKVKFAVAGGFAVSLHGALRATFDIDIVVQHQLKNFLLLEKSLSKLNLRSRLPLAAEEVFNFKKEYIQKRNLIAWSFVDSSDPLKLLDVILTFDLGKHQIVEKNIAGVIVPVLAKEPLIKMKQLSGRPQDLEDIRALRKL